ncbi:uncharacterized protein LOC144829284 [Lissotriton helveticus]
MNTAPASENGPYPTNHTRPFFYAQPTAQQPFPNPWYLGQVYNPYCLPAPGFRSGNPYFPFYSVSLQEYPGFYVPQPPNYTRMARRPHFNPPPPSPMFYHATRFRHFSSQGRRTECKETQTELRVSENMPKRNGNLGANVRACDAVNMTVLSSGIGTVNESISENLESSRSSGAAVQERDFHKNASTSASYRNLLPGSYAFEKEEVRIEYGSGSPAAIQLWKSYKETIPLYDVANDKEMADDVVKRDVYSLSSCEGVRYGARPEGEMMSQSAAYPKDECRAALPPLMLIDAVQEKDVQCLPSQNNVVGLEPEKRAKASPGARPGLQDTESPVQSSNLPELANSCQDFHAAVKNTESKNTIRANGFHDEESDHREKDGLSNASMEELKDVNVVNHGEVVTCDGELALWAEESVESYVPSASWLACLDNVENNCNYDICLSDRKQKRTSVLSVTSDDLSSRDEGSSMDNGPVSYYMNDYLLRKSLYSFRKSTDSSEKEKIKSGGSLNEDGECTQRDTNAVSTQYNASRDKKDSSQKVEVSGRSRKLGVSLRDVSRRKLYSLKKKPRKNMSLSEPEDSEDYWVVEETVENGCEGDGDDTDEGEYFLEENIPQGKLNISNGKVYKAAPPQHKVVWKYSKGAGPPQLIRWPSSEKVRMKKKGVLESSAQIRRTKQKEQEVDYEPGSYIKRPTGKPERCFEVPDERRASQKLSGGKSHKGNIGMPNEEYWTGRGAKPKLSEQPFVFQSAAKSQEQEKLPRKRGLRSSSKNKPALPEPEEVEVWIAPKTFGNKGRGTRRTFYRR